LGPGCYHKFEKEKCTSEGKKVDTGLPNPDRPCMSIQKGENIQRRAISSSLHHHKNSDF
jgi:hypothetical protein